MHFSHRFGAVICFMLVAACSSLNVGTGTAIPSKPAVDSAQFEFWQKAALGANKIGYRHQLQRLESKELQTEELLSVSFAQPGSPTRHSEIRLVFRETQDGKPLSVSKFIDSDSVNQRQFAQVVGTTLRVDLDGEGHRRILPLPQDFLLKEGVRQALLRQEGAQRHLHYSDWSFSRQRFQAIEINAEPFTPDALNVLIGDSNTTAQLEEQVDQYHWLLRRKLVEQDDASGSEETLILADAAFRFLVELRNTGGEIFSLVNCTKDCALADFAPITHVYRQLIRSPYRISDIALSGTIRYRLEDETNLAVPATGEQKVAYRDDGVDITVCRNCGDEPPPTALELQTALRANYWLQSDHAELQARVAEVLPERELSVDATMQRLTHFVTRHMNAEATYSGYATALQALRSGEGDCTEHALLLAALGRAAGVPTRVALGLAYNNDRFLGRRFVFVPHAWAQAWDGERWRSYDSGLGDFTAGYITLGLSNGEQETILTINEQLHRLKITSAMQIKSR